MIKTVLEHIGSISTYGVISILLFFACFLGVIIWAFTRKRSYREEMKNLPLEDDDSEKPDSQSDISKSNHHE